MSDGVERSRDGNRVRIVVDAMGGDHGPSVVLDGAVQAAREFGVLVTLVGPREELERRLGSLVGSDEAARLGLEVADAPEVIEMGELPLPAIRRKKRSSIMVGLERVRDGQGDAFVSAGHTGAVMAGATLTLRRLRGVERPALAALLPSASGRFVLVDVGANVEVKPSHLEQFAVMGSCYLRAATAVDRPRVALLSIGEEASKGNELIRQVHRDLREGPVHFIGNVDGKDVFSGEADVIVTDGFTGNAILKTCESLMSNVSQFVAERIRGSLRGRLGYLLLRPIARALKARLDHSEYGAVPLLGVGAPVFIGHGASSSRSIRSAIRAAQVFVQERVNETITRDLEALAEAAAEASARERRSQGAEDDTVTTVREI